MTDEPQRLDQPRPLEDERDELGRQRAANKDAVRQLAAQGIQVTSQGMLALRLDMLAEALLGSDDTSLERVQWELAYERKVAERLEDVQGQANRAKLLQGVPGGG